jgi:hypothetical protein
MYRCAYGVVARRGCSQRETDGGDVMSLQTVRAVYQSGNLIFTDPTLAPKDGTEVVVTFVEKLPTDVDSGVDPIQALRGRGKGEKLVEKLLQSRREDRERDEQSHKRLCA